MKEHPILFSAPMVRAILEGRKTQTRRVVKPQPGYHYYDKTPFDTKLMVNAEALDKGFGCYVWDDEYPEDGYMEFIKCPYGQPGDRLWVRETWCCKHPFNGAEICSEGPCYKATDEGECGAAFTGQKWKPSIHMPRWASRITLEVTGVRVERLQEISEEDAAREGVTSKWPSGPSVEDFESLWTSINGRTPQHIKRRKVKGKPVDKWEQAHPQREGGPFSWESNPFVWVVEFRRIAMIPHGKHELKAEEMV